MNKNRLLGLATAAMALFALTYCKTPGHNIIISNDSDIDRMNEIVELNADSIAKIVDSKYFYITDADGKEIVSQFTHDGRFIFPATVAAGQKIEYNVIPCDTIHRYTNVVYGRKYPERADDISYENQYVGFRIYGPATQAKGEKAFGYDIFLKHPTDELIVEQLYAPETDPATWRTVDSLRAINNQLAEDYIKTFSYHIDHGLGMDCYAVGPTLGAGVAAIVDNDSICFPWCYNTADILDNGPLRFSVQLDFAPVKIGVDESVTEHRIISLDYGEHLNKTKVWYDGLSGKRTIAAGLPRRDDSKPGIDSNRKYITYADPTQGPDNGKAMLGVLFSNPADSIFETQGHIIGISEIAPNDSLTYYWGFAWDRADISNFEDWNAYIKLSNEKKRKPLTAILK